MAVVKNLLVTFVLVNRGVLDFKTKYFVSIE